MEMEIPFPAHHAKLVPFLPKKAGSNTLEHGSRPGAQKSQVWSLRFLLKEHFTRETETW